MDTENAILIQMLECIKETLAAQFRTFQQIEKCLCLLSQRVPGNAGCDLCLSGDHSAEKPQLKINVEQHVAFYRGKPYSLTIPQAVLLEYLQKKNGVPESEAKIIESHPDLAVSKLKRDIVEKMPQDLQQLIRSKPGTGSWLEL